MHDAMFKTPSHQDLNDITIEEQTGKAVIKADGLETEQEAAPVPSNTSAETSKPKDNFMPITRAHRQAYERAVQLGETLPGTMKRWLQLQGIIKHALSPEPPARRKILEPKSQKPVDATEPPLRGLNSIGQSNNKFTPIHTTDETSTPMENFIPITRAHRQAYERAVHFGETLPGTMKRWLQLQGIIKHALSPEPPARRKILEPKSQKPVDATEPPLRGLHSIGQNNNKFTPIHTAAETSKPHTHHESPQAGI
jgi:hypothetical protein